MEPNGESASNWCGTGRYEWHNGKWHDVERPSTKIVPGTHPMYRRELPPPPEPVSESWRFAVVSALQLADVPRVYEPVGTKLVASGGFDLAHCTEPVVPFGGVGALSARDNSSEDEQ